MTFVRSRRELPPPSIGDTVNLGTLAALLLAVAALMTSVVGYAAFRNSKKSNEEVGSLRARATEFDIMDGTIDVLRTNLQEAQKESDELKASLVEARADCRKLNSEVTIALANVATLNAYIDQHVDPEIPRPRLRRVPNGY